jgi:hypothetical protein
MVRGGCRVAAQQIGAPVLKKKQIREVIRTMDLAADESDQASQDAPAQLARVEALLSKLEEWRRLLTK